MAFVQHRVGGLGKHLSTDPTFIAEYSPQNSISSPSFLTKTSIRRILLDQKYQLIVPSSRGRPCKPFPVALSLTAQGVPRSGHLYQAESGKLEGLSNISHSGTWFLRGKVGE